MKKISTFICGLFMSTQAYAGNWTLNLGFQNPGVSQFGVNFMHEWTNWAVELGIGNISARFEDDDKNNNDKDDSSIALAGDVDVKYFFNRNKIRPYMQLGKFLATRNLDFGSGGLFVGGGFFFGQPKLHGYLSLNYSNNLFAQAGIGFDI